MKIVKKHKCQLSTDEYRRLSVRDVKRINVNARDEAEDVHCPGRSTVADTCAEFVLS